MSQYKLELACSQLYWKQDSDPSFCSQGGCPLHIALNFIAWGSGLGVTTGSETASSENHGLVPGRLARLAQLNMRKHRGYRVPVTKSESQPPGMRFVFVCQVPLAGRKAGQMNARPFVPCQPLHCHVERPCCHKLSEIVTRFYSYDYCACVDSSTYPGTVNAIK